MTRTLSVASPSSAGFSLGEITVAMGILVIIFAVGMSNWLLAGAHSSRLESQVDDVASLVDGLHRLRLELLHSRGVLHPLKIRRSEAVRHQLVYWDSQCRLSAVGVVGTDLVVDRLGPGAKDFPNREILIKGVHAVVFDNRRDIEAIRYQVFFDVASTVQTVRPVNDMEDASFAFLETYERPVDLASPGAATRSASGLDTSGVAGRAR